MERITTLDLMKKNYDVQYEAEKLENLFFSEPMFVELDMFSRPASFSYRKIFDEVILPNWKFRQTYVDADEIFKRNNLYIDFSKKYTNEQLVNFIELIKNILYEKPDLESLKEHYNLMLIEKKYTLMLDVLDALIKNLGLDEKQNPEGWIVLIPKNGVLDKVIENYTLDVQWEIVSYLKIKDDDLETKRKHLAHLATELCIEKDSREKGYAPFDMIMNECTLILNNLQIRHNNKTGKWANKVIKDIDIVDAIEYCDILYNKMLQIVLMRNDLYRQKKITQLAETLKNK